MTAEYRALPLPTRWGGVGVGDGFDHLSPNPSPLAERGRAVANNFLYVSFSHLESF